MKAKKPKRKRQKLPEPVTITLPGRQTYNPTKAEMEQEFDMPVATLKQI